MKSSSLPCSALSARGAARGRAGLADQARARSWCRSAPGSTPDVVARLIADHLQKKLGQPFVIDNKPGASGNIGTDAVAKAAPDGTTIGVSIGGPLAINTLLFSKLPYDPKTDIAPITQLVTQPSALAVNSSVMVNSVAELVALLKREPGKYNFGSIGNGSLSHLAMEAIALASGTQDGAHPLRLLARGDDRDHPRRRADGLPAGDLGHAACRLRRGQDPRGLDRQALALSAGHSDAERGRNRRRSRRLDGHDRAGAYAGGASLRRFSARW